MAPERRGSYLAVSLAGGFLRRLNLHIDETGNQDLSEGSYLVTIVMHDHSDDIGESISKYNARLALANLPDVPFHGVELLHGHGEYENVGVGDRKRLLTQFSRLVRSLPFQYTVLRYAKSDTHGKADLEAKMRRDLVLFVYDHLSYFQSFDSIAVYYDGGQGTVSASLRAALSYVLANDVADYREADYNARRLLQVADYICTIERAVAAFDAESQTKTLERFFGGRRNLMQSYAKQLVRKRFH